MVTGCTVVVVLATQVPDDIVLPAVQLGMVVVGLTTVVVVDDQTPHDECVVGTAGTVVVLTTGATGVVVLVTGTAGTVVVCDQFSQPPVLPGVPWPPVCPPQLPQL